MKCNNEAYNNIIKNDKSESDYVSEIFEIIDNLEFVEFNSFVRLIAQKGLWTYYRRNVVTFNKYISNHNLLFFSNNRT